MIFPAGINFSSPFFSPAVFTVLHLIIMSKARVLIVDDEPAARAGLSELASDWGYETQVAADGEEALTIAAEFLPAAVISDIFMPRLNGFGLLTKLRELSPDTAVILLTGQASIEDAMRAAQAGERGAAFGAPPPFAVAHHLLNWWVRRG